MIDLKNYYSEVPKVEGFVTLPPANLLINLSVYECTLLHQLLSFKNPDKVSQAQILKTFQMDKKLFKKYVRKLAIKNVIDFTPGGRKTERGNKMYIQINKPSHWFKPTI